MIDSNNLEVGGASCQVQQGELNLSVPIGINVEAPKHPLMGSIPDCLCDHRAGDVTSVLMLEQFSQ